MYRETNAWRAEFDIQGIMAGYSSFEKYTRDGARINDVRYWNWQQHPVSAEAQLANRFAIFKRLNSTAPGDGAPILLWRVGEIDYPGIVREGLVD
eukprot:8840509-Pyramimonas_sp.AAC.1